MNLGTQIGPYTVVSLIGQGGMGTVYRARDSRLNRDVALKVLTKDFAEDAARLKRFEQEAQALASLNHPNVLSIYDVGNHEGTPYLVSELLRGQSLRDVLGHRESTALPPRKAMEYGQQIAEGLAAAHAKGVIHRDLKPENIFVTQDGRVKVLDFGVAKLRNNSGQERPKAGSPGGHTIRIGDNDIVDATAPGMIIGTPAYMSPEQVCGDPVDERSDIFSFGCVLYEMLSGRPVFKRGTAAETLAAVLKEEPAELTSVSANPPTALNRIVSRCLEKNRTQRFQTASDLRFALESASESLGASRKGSIPDARTDGNAGAAQGKRLRLVAGLGLLTACCICLTLILKRHQESGAFPDSTTSQRQPVEPVKPTQSVAVLPFVNMSADKDNDYLSDGITEELLNSLTKVRGLRVPGRGSCFAFKGKSGEDVLKVIGEKLRVNAVLEGSVRKAGDRLRIAAQLVNVSDGFELWSDEYDRDLTNIFAIQSDIAERVASALKVQLGIGEAKALAKKPTQDTEAYRLYLLGRYHFAKVTQAGWSNSALYFNQAIQVDPKFALAYCGLADDYGFWGGFTMQGKQAWAKEKELAQHALELDPDLADAHLSLGIALASAFDWLGGEREMKRALELNPQLVLGLDQYAWLLALTGRLSDAVVEAKKAIELEPLSPLMKGDLALWYEFSRDYDDAITQARDALELDRGYAFAHTPLAFGMLWKGNIAGAISEFEEQQRIDNLPTTEAFVGYAYARSGNQAKAEAVLGNLEAEAARGRFVPAGAYANIYLGLGEKAKALDWLEKAYEEQDQICWYLKVDPIFDVVRNEPRFQALLRKLRLDN
jgi:serine/threonine protein kinase